MSHYRLRIQDRFFETLEDRTTHIYIHTIVSFAASEFSKNSISEGIRDCSIEADTKTVRSAMTQIAAFFETRAHISPDIGEEWHEEAYAFYEQAIDTFLKTADLVQGVDYESSWARILRSVADQVTPYRDGLLRLITVAKNEESEYPEQRQIPMSKHAIFNANSIIPAIAADISLMRATVNRKVALSRSEEKEMEYEGVRDALEEFSRVNYWNSKVSQPHKLTDQTMQAKIQQARGIFNYASDVFIGNNDFDLACLSDSLDSWIGELSEREARMIEIGQGSKQERIIATHGNVTEVSFGKRSP